MPDEEVNVKMSFEDDYTDGVKRARKETEELDEAVEDVTLSSVQANIEFMSTVEALDKFGGGVAKVRAGVEDLGIANEATVEALRKIEGATDLFVGSAEIAVVTMFAWKKATDAQKLAMVGLGATAVGVGAAIAAVNAQTAEQRALYSVLTGATFGLAAAEFTLAAAKAASWTAGAGPLSPAMAAVITGALVAVAAGMATYRASTTAAPSAQTAAGETKIIEVERTGELTVHAGEKMVIGRPGPGGDRPIGRAPVVVNFVGFWTPLDQRGMNRTSEIIGRMVSDALGGEL